MEHTLAQQRDQLRAPEMRITGTPTIKAEQHKNRMGDIAWHHTLELNEEQFVALTQELFADLYGQVDAFAEHLKDLPSTRGQEPPRTFDPFSWRYHITAAFDKWLQGRGAYIDVNGDFYEVECQLPSRINIDRIELLVYRLRPLDFDPA